jgi:fatty acid/phospholipid biosynthesis enzyme
MKAIVVDTTGNNAGTSILIQAIKVFNSKHKDVTIYAVGNTEKMSTMDSLKEVNCVPTYNQDKKQTEDPDTIAKRLFEVMDNTKAPVLLTSLDKKRVLDEANVHFKKTGLPIFVSYFFTSTLKKFSFLADCGVNKTLSGEDFQNVYTETKLLAQSVFDYKDTSFSLLGTSTDIEDLPSNYRDAYDLFESNPDFKGITPAADFIKGSNSIYLADGFTNEIIIKTVYSFYETYVKNWNTYQAKRINAKLAVKLASGVFREIDQLSSSKIDSTGLWLLGYDKMLVKLNQDSTVGSIYTSLNNINNYLKALPENQ